MNGSESTSGTCVDVPGVEPRAMLLKGYAGPLTTPILHKRD
jgi:hypothetical protein